MLNVDNEALMKTANFYKENALSIREKDAYADHVTEDQKDKSLKDQLEFAEEILKGEHLSIFSVAQRYHFYLTGESTPLFSK